MTDLSKNTADSQVILNQIVSDYLKEQRSIRRWRWVRRGLFLIIALLFIYEWQTSDIDFSDKKDPEKPHVGLIDINGVIFEGQSGGADNLSQSLSKAYKNKGLKAIVLRINSPGGSPVQADYMFSTIKYYQKKYPDIKIHAVCVDLCASAAYYVAAAADDIYANPASMVGSIGVIYNGFGFIDLMQKLGVARRMQTAGAHKGFLDPFSPETPEDKAFLQRMLDEVHEQFIARVKEGRGARLHPDQNTFSGLIWSGTDAKSLGLIDDFASAGQLIRDKIGIEQVIDYTYEPAFYEKFAKNMGTELASDLPKAMGLGEGFR